MSKPTDLVIDVDVFSNPESSPRARNLGRGARMGGKRSSPIQIDGWGGRLG